MDWLSRASVSRNDDNRLPLTIKTLLIALIKAYEIQGCYQMGNAFNVYGIDHVVLVKLAAAAVVSWLLGLTEDQARAAISHVWMDGHPTRVYRSGAETIPRKGWAAGDAARRAVQLALVVRAGQAGAPGALTTPRWGFLERTFGEAGFQLPRSFETWTIQNVLFKVMPVEGHGIAAVEAALVQHRALQQRGWPDPTNHIQRIVLRTTAAADLIINKTGPLQNAADRDHCIQYVVALAFLKGSAPEAADYANNSQWASNKKLEYLRSRIEVYPDAKLTQDYLDLDKKSIGSGVSVHLNDGSSLSEVLIEYPIGHVQNPKTSAAIQTKFAKNMRHMFSEAEVARISKAAEDDDMRVMDFIDLLVRPAPSSPQPRL